MENDLVCAARAGDAAALETLMHQYKPLVKARANEYFISGGDIEDLIQEGMIGLYKAVLSSQPGRGAPFSSFAALCVVRQIQSAIKAASRNKHMPLNTSLPLHTSDTQNHEDLPDRHTPETLVLAQESFQDIGRFIQQNLSKLEYSVLMLYMGGESQSQIAQSLGKTPKSIDNTLQRIRRKTAGFYGNL